MSNYYHMSKLALRSALENMTEQLRESESKITNLEIERNKLLAGKIHYQLQDIDSAKLAEKRQRRLQALEKQKSEMQQRYAQQARLAEERQRRVVALEKEKSEMQQRHAQQAKQLEVREEEAAKIKSLKAEIQTMKESKVKLMRSMRHKSENFRQLKLVQEKELMKLRKIDRKRQAEMARNEALHTKQRNVLKRKCEEAINKRLADDLEHQRLAQTQRENLKKAKDASCVAIQNVQLQLKLMRQELEKSRQWKLTFENELKQLRKLDLKRQNEMARNVVLRIKEFNVLSIKADLARGVTKRLEMRVKNLTLAQAQRQISHVAKAVRAVTAHKTEQSKVKLIRRMHHQSEHFRQLKLVQEKELMRLRNIDRKRQAEMARNEALHTKQINVLKRKCEEALAINKRQKDVLERQRLAQLQRQKLQSVKQLRILVKKADQTLIEVIRNKRLTSKKPVNSSIDSEISRLGKSDNFAHDADGKTKVLIVELNDVFTKHSDTDHDKENVLPKSAK